MPFHRYARTLVFPLLAALGLLLGGGWTWLLPALTFGLIPALELVLRPDPANRPPAEEARVRAQSRFDWLVRSFVPIQLALLLLFLQRLSDGAWSGLELAGAVATMGICCGTFGINVGHELGHRRARLDQVLAKIALSTSLYAHFFIEHNRGHHHHVSTPQDPASAPQGRTVYGHWLRAVPGTWRAAARLEAERLRRKGRSPLSWDNEHLRLQLGQLGLLAAIALAFGGRALLGFAAAATLGFLLLETVNYVEHYGLRRTPTPQGGYERVRPAHSWNSDHPLGRVLLFELSRHSDHHANPGRPYPALRSFPDAPQFPTGYPGMIVLALLPPLFFALMHPRLARLAA
jgi:alkane 1-monooxygenase